MYGVEVSITMKSKDKDWLNSTMTDSKGLCYNTALLERQTEELEHRHTAELAWKAVLIRERVRFKINSQYYTKSNVNLKCVYPHTFSEQPPLFLSPSPHSYIKNKEARKHIRSIMISFEISILNRSMLLIICCVPNIFQVIIPNT